MAVLFCWSAIILLVACAVLQFTSRRALGCRLLVLFPGSICFTLLLDISHGVQGLGQASYHSELHALPYPFAFLVVAILAAFRPNWRWLFWSIWLISAAIVAVMVYLTFFWKVFS